MPSPSTSATASVSTLKLILVILSSISVIHAITVEDVYKRLLERERNIDNTFTNQFIKPIGSVGGELIWPRSYSKPSLLFFDENGASYNVAAHRPTLSQILRRTRIGNNAKNDIDDYQ